MSGLRPILCVCILLAVSLSEAGQQVAYAQLTGTTSLATIPVATMPDDGTITVGGGFHPSSMNRYGEGDHAIVPYYATITFLPFLELSFRFSRLLSDEPEALGDRMVSARLQLLDQRGPFPALLLGAHDMLFDENRENTHYNAIYAVASRSTRLPGTDWPLGLHLGYGSDALEAAHHEFTGLFGGFALSPISPVDLIVEYDGSRLTPALRARFFQHIQTIVAAPAGRGIAFGMQLHARL